MRLFFRASRHFAFLVTHAFCDLRVFGIHGVPRTGPVLLATNHQSFLDPLLLTYRLPRECHYMARDTLFTNPYFGRVLRAVNAFPITQAKADMAGVKETLRRLKAGALVLTFPEGTRSADGRVRAFQRGVFAIARRAGAPVVPAVIEGAFEVWPRTRRLPHRARIWVQYGRPILSDAFARLDDRQAAADLTRRVRTLHNTLRQRIGRAPFRYDPDD